MLVPLTGDRMVLLPGDHSQPVRPHILPGGTSSWGALAFEAGVPPQLSSATYSLHTDAPLPSCSLSLGAASRTLGPHPT